VLDGAQIHRACQIVPRPKKGSMDSRERCTTDRVSAVVSHRCLTAIEPSTEARCKLLLDCELMAGRQGFEPR